MPVRRELQICIKRLVGLSDRMLSSGVKHVHWVMPKECIRTMIDDRLRRHLQLYAEVRGHRLQLRRFLQG